MAGFGARTVAFRRDEELGTEYLVLAENQKGSGERLEFQRALIITDDDRRLGLHLADPQKMADEVTVGLRAILGSPWQADDSKAGH